MRVGSPRRCCRRHLSMTRSDATLATLRPVLRRLLTAALLAAALSAVAVPSASAASSSAVADCNAHGKLTQHYSVAQLRNALATMPADEQEYTNCYNVIQSQMLAEIPGHHGSGTHDASSGGSSFISTPLLIVLIVLVLGGGALAGVALQRRGGKPPEG